MLSELDQWWSIGELLPAAKPSTRTLAASPSGRGPITVDSLADTEPALIQPPSSSGDSPLQPAAADHPLHATAPEAVAAVPAALLPADALLPAASPATSVPPLVAAPRARAPAAATLQNALKLASPMSAQLAMRQRLQQCRTEVQSSQQQQVQPSELPVTYAVSSLTQPGPLFMNSFLETRLDSSTTLPQASSLHKHGQASTAGQDALPCHMTCIIPNTLSWLAQL